MAVFTVPVWKDLPCTLALPLLFWTWLAGPRRPLNLVKDKLASSPTSSDASPSFTRAGLTNNPLAEEDVADSSEDGTEEPRDEKDEKVMRSTFRSQAGLKSLRSDE